MLAIIAAERLHGQAGVRRSLCYRFSEEDHACVISRDTVAARDVAMIFAQYLSRDFGEDAFQVTLERIDA